MEETGLTRLLNESISREAPDEEAVKEIRLRVFDLAAKRAERYAMGDSSIRTEIFREIVKSVCFTLRIGAETKEMPLFEAISGDIRGLMDAGETALEKKIRRGRELLENARTGAVRVDNISYLGVASGIEKFFKSYDYRFFAHEIPGDIDYQLCLPVPESLEGIEYISEYLRRLGAENELCGHFDAEKITALLECCCADYRELLINIFEPVAVNALGLEMLGEDVFSLDITEKGRTRLEAGFAEWGETGGARLADAAERLGTRLGLSDECTGYLSETAAALFPRITAALTHGGLEGIFVHIGEKDDSTSPRFIDGIEMADERLRELIDELGEEKDISRKIELVKREIRSMNDLAEVLNLCFWGGECEALFKELVEAELERMLRYVEDKGAMWSSESGWERELKGFLAGRGELN